MDKKTLSAILWVGIITALLFIMLGNEAQRMQEEKEERDNQTFTTFPSQKELDSLELGL
jgi:hypothetical protein